MKELYLLIIGFIIGFFIYPFINNYLFNKFVRNKKIEEDILKEIYNFNKENKVITIDILHKKINTSISNLLNILSRLINLNYIFLSDSDIKLTNKGKEEAKIVINKHRLIERYLFEKTSTDLKEMHKVADEREHVFDEEKIIDIQNELSNPCIDPHGDILDENLNIVKKLVNLGNCEINKIYVIKHIEDEPSEIYKYLVNLDIAPFDKIKILKIEKNYINIINDKGKIISLNHIYANNIFVQELENDERIKRYFDFLIKSNVITLDNLKLRNPGLIIGLSFYIRGVQRQRLMELGFIKGNIVIPLYNNSISDDPRAYKINNSIISLRKEHVNKIYVIDLFYLNNLNKNEIKQLINV